MYGNNAYYFSVAIDADTLLELYRGSFRRVRVRCDSGLLLEIDAEHFKNYTTRDGIYGRFKLTTNQENKFVSLIKLGD